MYDVIIKGGTVVDGTGAQPQVADIGVTDGRIAEVGRISDGARTRRRIDANGALVLPGWVDAHTHYDGQVTWDDRLEGSAANGVTTVVMGNCGVGFAPVPKGGAEDLIDLMEGVEDIPGTALFEGMPWGAWETFPEYLSYLDTRAFSLDVCAQLAHGALRFYVMGERAITREAATADELEAMARIADAAVRSGAVGFSTSRIMGHKSMSGYCVPGTFAAEAELLAIATAMRDAGGAVLQAIPASTIGQLEGMEPEHSELLDEVRRLGNVSRATGQTVVFTTVQSNDAPERWRAVLAAVDEENRGGADLHPMIAPRAATVLTTLRGYHRFMQRPTYLKLKDLPPERLVAELRKPEVKAAILSEADVPDPAARRDGEPAPRPVRGRVAPDVRTADAAGLRAAAQRVAGRPGGARATRTRRSTCTTSSWGTAATRSPCISGPTTSRATSTRAARCCSIPTRSPDCRTPGRTSTSSATCRFPRSTSPTGSGIATAASGCRSS